MFWLQLKKTSIGLHAKGKLYLQSEKTAAQEGMIEDN